MRVHKIYLVAAGIACLLVFSGCRHISIGWDPAFPKQGDTIKFNVTIGDSGNMKAAKVWIGGQETSVTTGSKTISFNTCKYSTGTYYTSLEVKGEVIYDDNEVKTTGPSTIDLTTGWANYEDSDRTYSIYVAHDNDDMLEDAWVEAASEFINTFSAYPLSKYEWAYPGHFNDPNAPDMIIAFGHGNHHTYAYGPGGGVDLSTTAFGNFAFCNQYADLEYIIFFFSCYVLSMDDSGGHPFHWYWLNTNDNRLSRRPFMGLHQALGFRTLSVITFSCFGVCSDDADDFFYTFSEYLDNHSAIRSAWFWTIEEELDMDDGNNRGAVLFNANYEHDTVYTAEKDDYIHGAAQYDGNFYIDYHQ